MQFPGDKVDEIAFLMKSLHRKTIYNLLLEIFSIKVVDSTFAQPYS